MTTIDADRRLAGVAARAALGESELQSALRLSQAASNAIHLADSDGLERCFRPGCHVVSAAETLPVSEYGASLSRSSEPVGTPGLLTSLPTQTASGLCNTISQISLRRDRSTGSYAVTLERVTDDMERVDARWQVTERRVEQLTRLELPEASLAYVTPDPPRWQDLAAVEPVGVGRREIRRVLDGCARATDRQQAEHFRALTGPEFSFRVREESSTVEEFLAMSRGKEPTRFTCQHYVGPSIVDIDGETATSLCMLMGVMVLRPTGDGSQGPIITLTKSTYADTLYRRDGAWVLAVRELRQDWSARLPTALAESIAGTTAARRDGSDPSCVLLGSPSPQLPPDDASARAVESWRARDDGRLRLNSVVGSMTEAAEVYFVEVDEQDGRISGGRELLWLARESDDRYEVVQTLSLTEWSALGAGEGPWSPAPSGTGLTAQE